MVWKKYEDQTIDEALQNRFTGYLQSAVRRQRAAYIDKLNHLKYFVNADLSNVEDISYDLEDELLKSFPLHLQIQNEKLFLSIAELTEREQYVFFHRALEELSMEEMAAELGMSYKAVAATYYRAIRKLKNRMQGGTI